MKRILFVLLAMFQLFSCTARDRQGLIFFELSSTNSMIYDGTSSWKAEQLDDGSTRITTKEEGYEPVSFNTSGSFMQELCEIVNRYKMYNYKGDYVTRMKVLDGSNWGFSLKYSDGTGTSASGYMKYPRNYREATSEIRALFSEWCAAPDSAKLKSFYYSSSGMMHRSGERYEVRKDSDGNIHVNIDEDKMNEKLIITDYRGIFNDLQKIVSQYRMNTYKGSYMPQFEILDGESWSFGLSYEDDQYISASGYEAWPEGFKNALAAVRDYFSKWRLMPVKNGKVSAEDAEAFLAGFEKHIDSELTSFRYERYDYGKSKVYYVSKNENFTSFYYRGWGTNKGYTYYCGNPNILYSFKSNVIDSYRLAGFPQTPLSKENTKRSRWIVKAEFADGTVLEIIDYIPDTPYEYDRLIEGMVDAIIEEGMNAIRAKSPAEIGEYSVTTYDANGKPSVQINYDGEGRVLNGRDFNDPLKTY